MENIEAKEIMISRNGKPIFAIVVGKKSDSSTELNYVFIENGDIKFASSWMSNIIPFNLGSESHRYAKEIFTIGLQAAVKTKVYELKQLESILGDLNLSDCLGNVLIDNSKMLMEISDRFESRANEVIVQTRETAQKWIMTPDKLKDSVAEAIVENVKPIAVRKKKADTKVQGEKENGLEPTKENDDSRGATTGE